MELKYITLNNTDCTYYQTIINGIKELVIENYIDYATISLYIEEPYIWLVAFLKKMEVLIWLIL